MKKIALSLGLSFALTTSTFAANNIIDQLNSQIASILSPLQNSVTVAKVNFDAVEIDDERALKVGLNAHYRKIGPQNIFEIKIDNLNYNYGDGTAPMTVLKGSIGLDITKILTPDELTTLIPQAAEMVEEMAINYSEYGKAFSIRSVVTSMTKDATGNYTGLTALIAAKIDLTKLPEDQVSENIMLTDAVLSLTLNLKTGVMIDAFVASNPNYSGFKENEEGLKERLEKLVEDDDEIMFKLEYLTQMLDDIAIEIVKTSKSLWKDLSISALTTPVKK